MTDHETNLDRAYRRATAKFERTGDLDGLSLPERTLMLITSAQGIIDNGGLQYFFESDWPGLPPYDVFVDAYRAIGCEAEANALSAAVKLFPFASPHLFQEKRDDFLSMFLEDCVQRQDSPFEPYTAVLCGNTSVWKRLQEFANCHADQLT